MVTLLAHVALAKTEVDNEDGFFGCIGFTNHKIIWFYVAMDKSLLMNDLYTLDHLQSNMEACIQIKLFFAFLEEIFKTFSEKIHNHDMMFLTLDCLFLANKMYVWHRGLASQLMKKFRLPKQHGILSFGCTAANPLYLCSQMLSGLLLLNVINLSKRPVS